MRAARSTTSSDSLFAARGLRLQQPGLRKQLTQCGVDLVKIRLSRGNPGGHHQVHSRDQLREVGPHALPQPPLDAIADHGLPQFLADGKADPRHAVGRAQGVQHRQTVLPHDSLLVDALEILRALQALQRLTPPGDAALSPVDALGPAGLPGSTFSSRNRAYGDICADSADTSASHRSPFPKTGSIIEHALTKRQARRLHADPGPAPQKIFHRNPVDNCVDNCRCTPSRNPPRPHKIGIALTRSRKSRVGSAKSEPRRRAEIDATKLKRHLRGCGQLVDDDSPSLWGLNAGNTLPMRPRLVDNLWKAAPAASRTRGRISTGPARIDVPTRHDHPTNPREGGGAGPCGCACTPHA